MKKNMEWKIHTKKKHWEQTRKIGEIVVRLITRRNCIRFLYHSSLEQRSYCNMKQNAFFFICRFLMPMANGLRNFHRFFVRSLFINFCFVQGMCKGSSHFPSPSEYLGHLKWCFCLSNEMLWNFHLYKKENVRIQPNSWKSKKKTKNLSWKNIAL